jgi:hypothetical protein
MLNIIVFSKDRACQLELFLRSMKYYFKEFYESKINVLYTYSNDSFKNGYDKLIEIHNDDNINYIKETTNFKNHVLMLLDPKKDYSVFFVDDIIFKNEFTLDSKQFKLFTLNDEILTLSLRLNNYLDFCYAARFRMSPPPFENNNSFRWHGQRGDYGYPMSLDGHFFRTSDILPLTRAIQFKNPNSYESILAGYPLNRPKMICFEDSIIINNPINKVQDFNNNHHGNISADFLNDKFLEGKIVDLEDFKGIKNTAVHQEIDVNFIDYEKK